MDGAPAHAMTRYHRRQVIRKGHWHKLAPLPFAAAIGMALIVESLRGYTALDELADFESRYVSLRDSAAQQATANKLLRSCR